MLSAPHRILKNLRYLDKMKYEFKSDLKLVLAIPYCKTSIY